MPMAMLALCGGAQTLSAQEAQSSTSTGKKEIEEVTVTATRRETALQETPIAISAFGAEELKKFDMRDSRDLMSVVPNLYVQRVFSSPSTQQYGMRGLGQSDTPADPTVGVYIDDIYLPRSVAQLFDLPGIERVEVLRGPQGTLYGRNSTAGAIRYITSEPSDELRLSLSAGAGNYNALESHNLLSGPVVKEKVYGSIAGVYKSRDGYTTNRNTGKRVNNLDQLAVRGKLRFVLNDQWEIGLSADYENDGSDTVHYVPQTPPPGLDSDPRVTYETADRRVDLDAFGVSARAIYKANEDLTVKSITSYREFEGYFPNEFDGLPPMTATFLAIDHSALSQEFQVLADYSWGQLTAGLFYFKELYAVDARNALSTANLYFGGLGDLDTRSYAAYGQSDIPVGDKLTVTLGLRYTYEEREFYAEGYRLSSDLDITGTTYTASPSSSARSFTPKIGAQYQWTPDLMTYVSFSKGFQAGGYSLRAASASIANLEFGPEYVKAYEVGIKADWLGRRLRTNLTAFYNDITGKQVSVFLPEYSVATVQNAATAYTKGIELETTAALTDRLMLSASAGWLRTSYTDWPNAFGCPARCTNGKGQDLVYAPEWTANARLAYELPLNTLGALSFSADLQYQGRAYTRTPNGTVLDLERTSDPGYYLNTNVRYMPTDRLSFNASVRNVTDKTYRMYVFGLPGIAMGESYSLPRMYMITATYSYQ